jgi:hypothetical protein
MGKDARMLGIRSWWAAAINCKEWRKLLKEPRLSMNCSVAAAANEWVSMQLKLKWI